MTWDVYAVSLRLGVRSLGPVPEIATSKQSLSLTADPAVISRLFVGSLLVAPTAAGTGYVVALRSIRQLRVRDVRPSESAADTLRE